MNRRIAALAFACGLTLCTLSLAQSVPYDPYAAPEEFKPLQPNGKPNWPAFFRSRKKEQTFQTYFEFGSCTGNRKAVNIELQYNKVDINQLAEVNLNAISLDSSAGVISVVDSSGKSVAVVIHPLGLTKVNVAGEISASGLRPGMSVRLITSVDKHGHGQEPVSALEVFTPSATTVSLPIESGRTQSIVATVARLEGPVLRLRLAHGKLRRLKLTLDPDAKIEVHGTSLDLVSPGDKVMAKGHAYTGEGSLAAQTLFADEIQVEKGGSANVEAAGSTKPSSGTR